MGGCSKAEVYQKFLAFHQKDFIAGSLSPCTGAEELRRGKEFLDSVPSPCQRFQQLDFYRLAQEFVEARGGEGMREQPLGALGKAFGLLELISINLYLWPWRKEIKSIKTFTGAFVYFIEPVFPPEVLQGVLVNLGYTQKGTSEYVISKQVSKEDIGQLGFECFLARAECELMQETLEQAMHSSCQDVVQMRSCMSLNQADCIKHLFAMKTGSRNLSEWSAPASEGPTKSALSCEGGLDESELPSSPLPHSTNNQGTLRLQEGALEDREMDTANDPLSISMMFPPDSIDLYRDYTDIDITGNLGYTHSQMQLNTANPSGETGQCDSLLVLDQSMVQRALSESHIKLSPGQTGPQSLSFIPKSTLIASLSDSKNLKIRDRADFGTGDPKASLKHGGVLDATSQLYPEGKPSEKNYQKLDGASSVKYGKFLNGNSTSRKKESDPPVEIELKHIDKEKLPYPTAETSGPAHFHPTRPPRASEAQCVGLSQADPIGGQHLRQTHAADQLAACRVPSITRCCVCSPLDIPRCQLADPSELMGNMLQDGGGQIVREPPQSFYIPPDSLEAGPPTAISCDISGSRRCPHCSSELSANQRQAVSKDCLEIQELLIGESPDPYVCVSKLPEGSDHDRTARCSHCRGEEGL
ncbi:uncharacterized protein si:ch211-189a15.5 [Stegostoma tigrinum]|uniref:uncharacterized protein si:ch211-189a15.5 n=1 Tax=Stegostoma tigrinum TaxID=3053191 RepID=UPI00202B8CCF|nr:uncharacterized protein si:ch211-189a15.5 [Stegostoma tigrinum]